MHCEKSGAENSEDRRYCRECGSALPTQSVGRSGGPPPRTGPLKLRVNMFCLAGAILAVLSLFLPWTVASVEGWYTADTINFSGFDHYEDEGYPSNFHYSVVAFVIGTILAFFTPLGGIPQLIGSIGFIAAPFSTDVPYVEMTYGVGVGLALVSAILVLASLFWPKMVGQELEEGYRLVDLLTWSVYR